MLKVKDELKPCAEPAASVEFSDHAVCDVCGRFGAVEIGDLRLCVDCHEGCGSCCAESTMDDSTAA
jgi:hypothetical protein